MFIHLPIKFIPFPTSQRSLGKQATGDKAVKTSLQHLCPKLYMAFHIVESYRIRLSHRYGHFAQAKELAAFFGMCLPAVFDWLIQFVLYAILPELWTSLGKCFTIAPLFAIWYYLVFRGWNKWTHEMEMQLKVNSNLRFTPTLSEAEVPFNMLLSRRCKLKKNPQ